MEMPTETQNSEEYLNPEDQEFDLIDDSINGSPEQCDSKELIFEAKDELSSLIEQLKNKLQIAIFQIGSVEQVHDPVVLTKYKTLLKIIYDLFVQYITKNIPPPQTITETLPEIQGIFSDIVKHLEGHKDEAADSRIAFLKLHLICFPYCQRENCLSMD